MEMFNNMLTVVMYIATIGMYFMLIVYGKKIPDTGIRGTITFMTMFCIIIIMMWSFYSWARYGNYYGMYGVTAFTFLFHLDLRDEGNGSVAIVKIVGLITVLQAYCLGLSQ